MEHVSTLCAVSTIGIAASGFALACREQTSGLQSFASSRNSTLPRPSPSDTVNSNPSHHQRAIERSSHQRAGFQPVATASGQSLVLSQRRRERRRRQTVTNPLTKVVDETSTQDSGATSRRPSSSWLRRISIISSTASSLSSPTTATSSVNVPSKQTQSRPDSAVKAPNKLVKRSNSQRSLKQAGSGTGRPKSMTLGLRRPATSHQRSSDFTRRSSLSQGPDFSVPPGFLQSALARENDLVDIDSQHWRPFFGYHFGNTRQSSTSDAIVTIKPNRSLHMQYNINYPTLMLSTSIKTSHKVSKMGATHDSSEPPSTDAIPFIDPFSRHHDSINTKLAKNNIHEKRRTVRSSSISHPSVTRRKSRVSPMKDDVKSPLDAGHFHGNNRIVSNPLPRESGKAGSPRLRRKRNFTESDTLNRPQTAPLANHCQSRTSHIDEAVPRDLSLSVDPRTVSYDKKGSPLNGPPSGTSPIIRYSRNNRFSGAASDWASTVIGSDDTRVFTSADEDDQSDSVFDSFRTRISSTSQSGRRGPNIETIFHDVSADHKNGGSIVVEELGFENLRLSQSTPRSSLSDLDSNTTPVALSVAKNADATPTQSAKNPVHSSPLKLSRAAAYSEELVFDSDDNDDDDAVLEDGDDEFDTSFGEKLNFFQPYGDSGVNSPSLTRKSSAIGIKASVFDWSEQTWSERDPQAHEVRPSTVHGKQGPNARNTRRPSRKPPSAIHLRSQSVPVSRDGPVPTESRQPSAKFGTWGLGQKGVSEDWDGDFDFDDEEEGDAELGGGSTSIGRIHTMKVPQAIMESQASVHGQYGQVQELTLLVEELKRLRIHGNMLQVIHGPANELWREADGIVNLATFEDEDTNWQIPKSPSSCGSFDGFENSPSPPQKPWRNNESDTKRPPLTLWSDLDHSAKGSNTTEPTAKAKSVLETIYQQRESSEAPSVEIPTQPQQKLPFDTQSLKELVARAGVVTRALKDVIRRAEGVTSDDEIFPSSDPPFSQIFTQTS